MNNLTPPIRHDHARTGNSGHAISGDDALGLMFAERRHFGGELEERDFPEDSESDGGSVISTRFRRCQIVEYWTVPAWRVVTRKCGTVSPRWTMVPPPKVFSSSIAPLSQSKDSKQ